MINEYLLDYIGKTQTEKLQVELRKFVNENNRCSLLPMSLINSSKDSEIKSIGASVPNDLILTNFGMWIVGVVGRQTGSAFPFINDAGSLTGTLPRFNGLDEFQAFATRYADNITGVNKSVGWNFQLGKGSTPPARDDFNIETPLDDSPENGVPGALQGVFSEVNGTFTTGVTFGGATGSGSVSEIGLFTRMANEKRLSPTSWRFMMVHDLISPVVNYLPGQSINVEIVFQT